MRNIILTISILFSLGAFAQRESKVTDSTRFKKGVRFDSTLVFKGLKVAGISDTFVVIINSSGTAFKVGKSTFLSGISGGGGSQTLSISGDTLSISDGNSVVLPVYVQADSSTINSYDVLNSQNTPPVSPNTGDTYLVGNSPSGAWVGQAKDIAEWNGSSWDFTDGVQGDFLYNATTALTYIFRSGNWVQTTGIPALNNGNTISSGLRIGTNNARSLTFETNNVNRGRFDSIGRYYIYDTSLRYSNKYIQVDSLTGRLIATEIPYNDGVTQQALNDSIARLDSTINAIPVPTLQTVTDAGAITTNHIGVRSIEVGSVSNFGSIDIYSDSPSGFYTRILGANGMSADNVLTLPVDITTASYIPLTVNGIKADMYGNILLPLITSDSLAQIRQEISDTATQIRSEIADTASSLHTLIDAKVSASGTATLTNKRITARVDSTTSSATPTINTDNVDTYKLTAQAADITSFTTNLSGTPTDDQILHIVITGTASRLITWGVKFEASTVALPTTTVGTDRLDVYFIWNTNTSKWRCGGVW